MTENLSPNNRAKRNSGWLRKSEISWNERHNDKLGLEFYAACIKDLFYRLPLPLQLAMSLVCCVVAIGVPKAIFIGPGPLDVLGESRIRNFEAIYTLKPNGEVDIKETIQVYFDPEKNIRAYNRVLPGLKRRGNTSFAMDGSYHDISVSIKGGEHLIESKFSSSEDSFMYLDIFRMDEQPLVGELTFDIRYTVTNQLKKGEVGSTIIFDWPPFLPRKDIGLAIDKASISVGLNSDFGLLPVTVEGHKFKTYSDFIKYTKESSVNLAEDKSVYGFKEIILENMQHNEGALLHASVPGLLGVTGINALEDNEGSHEIVSNEE